jgi:hypothetical protein
MDLPVGGGLVVEPGGFVIYVRCEEEFAAAWTAVLADPQDGGRSLPARQRFSVAHELAHTLLYDLSADTPKSLLGRATGNELSSLERTCNRAAARLLLPDHLLGSSLGALDPIDAHGLEILARRFRVSAEVLIRRLDLSGIWARRGGIAMCVREYAGRYTIRAVAADGPSRLFFPTVYMADASSLLRQLGVLSDNGPVALRATEREIAARTGEIPTIQPCRISAIGDGRSSALLVTVHLGSPRVPEHKWYV